MILQYLSSVNNYTIFQLEIKLSDAEHNARDM